MWRSFFLAFGIGLAILGAEFLFVDKLILSKRFNRTVTTTDEYVPQEASATAVRRGFVPPEWAPWTLFSAGAVVVLYSVTLKRV